jgi:beta-glucosidase-like glycosyl hydrolase/CubicO group peptidase (beta-lactamase class C family)
MKKLLATSLLALIVFPLFAQQTNPLLVEKDFKNQQKWVDSIYSKMTLHEKVGQLFMAISMSSDSEAQLDSIRKRIREQNIGGIIFSKGGPKRQAKLNNEFQSLSKVPLLIGMDAEWGLAMRLDSTFAYPWNMTLGAIKDNRIVEKVGRRIGEHSKRLGVHINFAPVVDINTNPKNPIIGNRSFGEDKEDVTLKSLAFMKGMQQAGILANAKHFPGHGDTDSDSHKTLPTISFTKRRIDSIELYPYRRLIQDGLSSVMVAHLNVPAYEERSDFPSSLSKAMVTDLLKRKLGFKGLIFTDALNMKGASNFKEPGEIDLAAFLAGNDVLLISEDIPKAQQLLIDSYHQGVISEARLALSVKKILMAKYKVGLNKYVPVDATAIVEDLNSVIDDTLYEEAMENALTVLKNDNNLLPITDLQNKKIAYVNFGDDDGTPFLKQLQKYTKVDWVKADDLVGYIEKLAVYDYTIIGYHKSNDHPWKDHNFSEKELAWIYEIARTNKVILDVFARPYVLLDLLSSTDLEGLVLSYQNSKISQELSAQLIFGARTAKGRLPVSLGNDFPLHFGIETKSLGRLQYGTSESVGVNSTKLKKIDSLAMLSIDDGMTPGMQILVARKGKVIYTKNFGYHTQEKKNTVKENDVYDVASLTKILATLPLLMELADRDVIYLDTKLFELLPEYANSNKANISIQDMLMHYARLQAWIPFYTKTLDTITKKPATKYYSTTKKGKFNVRVAEDLFIRNDYKDTIFETIRKSDLRDRLSYRYSDLPFYILKKYLEEFYGNSMDVVVQRNIYESLGANYTTYLPLEKFSKIDIVPTEIDSTFRMQKVHGYVHDQGAAMLGGVSGHAGLFSNANDVAKIMQMYLWKGYYGGKQYFKPETFDKFNNCYYCDKSVRRGVGFDKPQLGDSGPTCGCVSMTSFGHSGFTGTFTWADPEEEIVYVFLSNRTYPDAENRKLISSNLRSNIQELIYEAIEN